MINNNFRETERMRKELIAVYNNSAKWAKKVNLMPPDQVTAVYLRFKSQNKVK